MIGALSWSTTQAQLSNCWMFFSLSPDRTELVQRDSPSLVQSLKLVENLSTSQCEFKAIRRPNQQIILKHCACALEGPAHGRLAEEQAGCCCGDAFLFGNGSKRNQQIQVGLA